MIKVGDTLPASTLMEYSEVEGEGCSIGPNPVPVDKATAESIGVQSIFPCTGSSWRHVTPESHSRIAPAAGGNGSGLPFRGPYDRLSKGTQPLGNA